MVKEGRRACKSTIEKRERKKQMVKEERGDCKSTIESSEGTKQMAKSANEGENARVIIQRSKRGGYKHGEKYGIQV